MIKPVEIETRQNDGYNNTSGVGSTSGSYSSSTRSQSYTNSIFSSRRSTNRTSIFSRPSGSSNRSDGTNTNNDDVEYSTDDLQNGLDKFDRLLNRDLLDKGYNIVDTDRDYSYKNERTHSNDNEKKEKEFRRKLLEYYGLV